MQTKTTLFCSFAVLWFFFFLPAKTSLSVASEPPGATASVHLGVITTLKAADIIVEYDPGINVPLGAIVAIFGLGSLERHPLTKKIILMGAEQVARAQVMAKEEGVMTARVIWKERDVEIGPGMDVVLLPEESAANSAPVIAGEITELKTLTQETAHLEIPIVDPDGDAVVYRWHMEGNLGGIGFLDARVTYLPRIVWFTPGIETKANLVVTATDSHFQTVTVKIPVVTFLPSSWSQRELRTIGKFGRSVESRLRCLTRDRVGQWWGTTDTSLVTISSGWRHMQRVSLSQDVTLFKPITLAPHRGNIYILDGSSRSIFTLRADGTHLRSFGKFSMPTDMEIGADGIVYVADRVAGEIKIYDVSGDFHAQLGASVDNKERFANLTRLTLGMNKELFALDEGTRIVHRFDSERRYLGTWPLPLKGKERPIDIAYHPKGHLLVLLDNGRIMTVIENGQFGMSMEPASGTYAMSKLEHPDSIFVDMSGDVFVTYGDAGLIARYNEKGVLSGLRGATLWALDNFSVDGAGHIYGLDRGNQTISCFDYEGWLVNQLGSIGLDQHLLKKPVEFAVKPDGSELVVLDADSDRLLRLQLADPGNPLPFSIPDREKSEVHKRLSLKIDDVGRTYVLDSKFRRILIFDEEGQFLFKFGRGNRKGFTRDLQKPSLFAVDPGGKFVYVYDKYEIKMFELDHDTGAAVHVVSVGSKGTGVAQFKKPIAMACDRRGLLYILDKSRRDLQVVTLRGNELSEIYTRNYSDWGLKHADGMVVNPDGRVFLVDSGTLVAVGW